jgi:NAD(P)-dependent dehydrogenase (short-subunit alcohol dehydrogenase family)
MESGWSAKDMPRQDGKRAVVTGANSGIGYFTALELARAGADVIIAVRDLARGKDATSRILADVPNAKLAVEALDLASLTSVRAFADRLVTGGRPLDLLVNNAGVMATPRRELTVDGFERQLATNHLGHFALTGLELPLLRAAPLPRVVTVSSAAALYAKLDMANLQGELGYDRMKTYGQSKLVNLLFMMELHRRYASTGLISVAVHPGVSVTSLQRFHFGWSSFARLLGQSADRGALPTLYGATASDVKGGMFFGPRDRFGMVGPPAAASLPRRALDIDQARRLWERSEELTDVRFARNDANISGKGVSPRAS